MSYITTDRTYTHALVTANWNGVRHLVMIERGDGYGWAVPGGHIEPGETGLQAAVRELAEETGLDVMSLTGVCMVVRPPRYVPDPRSSDEAWAVTWPVHIDLGDHGMAPAVAGYGDARRAEWIPADSYGLLSAVVAFRWGFDDGRVFAAHVAMLRDFLGREVPGARD